MNETLARQAVATSDLWEKVAVLNITTSWIKRKIKRAICYITLGIFIPKRNRLILLFLRANFSTNIAIEQFINRHFYITALPAIIAPFNWIRIFSLHDFEYVSEYLYSLLNRKKEKKF